MSFISLASWAIEALYSLCQEATFACWNSLRCCYGILELVLRPLYALSERRRSWQPRPATFPTHALSPRGPVLGESWVLHKCPDLLWEIFCHSATNALLHCASGPFEITAHGNQRMRQQDWPAETLIFVPIIPVKKSTTVISKRAILCILAYLQSSQY
jgi:hypothetical protein